MPRKKLSETEKATLQAANEKAREEKNRKVKEFKDANYLNTLSDSIIAGFINTVAKNYPGLDEKTAVELLFKKFNAGDFKFEIRSQYS